MDSSILNSFRLTVAEEHLGVYGIQVQAAGGESVSHRWRSDDPVNLYSGSKTYTSLAVGICVDDGRLKLTDRVLDFFPEYRETAAPGSEKIAVRDLLHMASGKLTFWFGEPDRQALEEKPEDWAELFFRVPVTKEPGTHFFYSNACTYMLGRIIEKISGKTLRDFLLPRLFLPLGIDNPQWHTCPRGHTLGATGLFLTTGEYARLGTLLLNGGVYNGRRIVSEAYLHEAVNDTVQSGWPGCEEPECLAGYGCQLWRCAYPGAYRADGKYGQFAIVIPDKGAAVTVTAHEEFRPYRIVQAVFEDIVPRLP